MARSSANPDKALTRIVHRILLGLIVVCSLVLLILWRTDNPRLERVREQLQPDERPGSVIRLLDLRPT